MAYYFMVERNKGQYQPLNISESKYFQTIPKFKKIGAYNLKEIDDFTMMFDNEEELRKALVSEEVLHPSISAKPLSIRCLKDGTFNRVEYDLLYQKDIEHMNCPEKLIEMILTRYYNGEFALIKKIGSHFSSFKPAEPYAAEVARFCEISIYQNKRYSALDEIDSNGDHLVNKMLKLIIYQSFKNSYGKTFYKGEVNYRNLHDLVALINHYDKKIQPEVIEEPTIYKEIVDKNVKTKKRTKKYNLDGQFGFDI